MAKKLIGTHIGQPDPKLLGQTMLHLIEFLQERGQLPVEEAEAEIVAQYKEEPVEEIELVA